MLIGVPAELKTVTAPPLMLSLLKAVRSLPITTPVPAVPPPVRAAVMVVLNPSAVNMFPLLAAIERSCVTPELNVMWPPLIADGVEVPVIVSIAPSSVPTVPVMLMVNGPAPVKEADVGLTFEKLMTLPSTVRDSPLVRGGFNESVPAAPDSKVALVIEAAGVCRFSACAPVTAELPKGGAG